MVVKSSGLRSGTVAVPQAVAFAKAARLAVEGMASHYEKYVKMAARASYIFTKLW